MAKVIMVQGTMSNAGKSLITAGLLRVFVQDGYSAAPFKSQNMALNSYITKDGLEMGRAQAMQAEACNIEPSVYMNPILLKPTTDIGSQVIVNGEAIGNMPAKEYFAYKKKLLPDIRRAYDKLAAQYDIIVVEGAGSPAEINLKENDIVNMGLAKLLDAPVLLVGDIDCGGVFAQLVGTLMLLEEDERGRVKGLIINKFRGDKSILDPGLSMLTELTHKPVVGVVPYGDIDIDDEDSLAKRLTTPGKKGILKIRIVRLPRISNFTDFHPLEAAEGLDVQYVKSAEEIMSADLILLPGSKSTMEDLLWLRGSGMEAAIKKKAATGTAVIGICGGYQMMGEGITDSEGLEGTGSIRGMELLPVKTIFEPRKRTVQTRGKVRELYGFFEELSGTELEGYEIHMGTSQAEGESFASVTGQDGSGWDGCVSGNCMGTYLHGIFDNQEFTERLLKLLLRKKGCDIQEIKAPDMKAYKQAQYDKLACLIRENVDMKAIYACMGMEEKTMIHVYYGEGKGKTTAAAGLALRAAGNGMRVLFTQFMKARRNGETELLAKLPGVTVLKNETDYGFYKKMTEEQKEQMLRMHNASLEKTSELIESNGCELVVLDEVFSAYRYGLLDREVVLSILEHAEKGQFELVLTGREPDAVFVEKADYITQMEKERHPFDRGVGARKGIEY